MIKIAKTLHGLYHFITELHVIITYHNLFLEITCTLAIILFNLIEQLILNSTLAVQKNSYVDDRWTQVNRERRKLPLNI